MCQSKQGCFSFFIVILNMKIVLILKHEKLSRFLPQYVEGFLNNRNTFFRTSEQMDVTILLKKGLFLLFYFSNIFSRFLY